MGAWNFTDIFARYEAWGRGADAAPKTRPAAANESSSFRSWAERECSAWTHIVACDPFLPAPLLPASYPGRAACSRRVRLLTSLGQMMAAP